MNVAVGIGLVRLRIVSGIRPDVDTNKYPFSLYKTMYSNVSSEKFIPVKKRELCGSLETLTHDTVFQSKNESHCHRLGELKCYIYIEDYVEGRL